MARNDPARPSARTKALIVGFLALIALGMAACSEDGGETLDIPGEWPTYSMNLDRTGFNPLETVITKESVSKLVVKWKFPTKQTVAASPAIATIDVPDEGPVRTVVIGSDGGNGYALRGGEGRGGGG